MEKLKVLANDGLEQKALERLKKRGIEVDTEHFEEKDLIETQGYDVIVIRSATKLNGKVIDAMAKKGLKMIIRAGVGLDNIDISAAQKAGVLIRNTPCASTNAVAELVLGHMICLERHIFISNITMRQGQWNKKNYSGMEIQGKVLGIIGFGRIGQALAQKAKGLGMTVIFYDKKKKTDPKYPYRELEALLQESDFISIHTDSVKRPVIGREEVEKMKRGVFLINAARGNVFDEEALLYGLESNRIGGLGLDVFDHEPNPRRDLVQHPRVSVTPHIGGSTREAQERIGEEVASYIISLREEGQNA